MSATLRKKLTLTVINALPPNSTIWDTELKGFCARRQRSPAITYQLKMRVHGKIRWFSVGRHGQATHDGSTWTPDTARRHAIKIMGDPTIAEKPNTAAKPSRPLFGDVADEFLKLHGAKLTRALRRAASPTAPVLSGTFVGSPTPHELQLIRRRSAALHTCTSSRHLS